MQVLDKLLLYLFPSYRALCQDTRYMRELAERFLAPHPTDPRKDFYKPVQRHSGR